ncbi:3D domain-containing protein [Bacillus sp. 165]|uniref:3D domain-containing protein n=1 Tax=Bacillus sp. 165 TaxID=1529117 RepID=UPI001AD9DFF2|nr:3D domain-containing protein [Bacillus sp. 165]MBO9129018.1 cell wall-binding protein [Bacillus sp. 165]
MSYTRRIGSCVLAGVLCITGTSAVWAQTNQETWNNMQDQLQHNDTNLKQKEQEKQAITKEIHTLEQELESLNEVINENKREQKQIQEKIEKTNKLIEQKKEEIILLEDKVHMRKNIIKNRMISLQSNDNTNLIISVLVNSDSIAEFFERASAAATILNADKDILVMQKEDLEQIEKDKEIINQQEQALRVDKELLAAKEAELEANLQKKQESLQAVQVKYNEITSQITVAENEKASLQASLKNIQAAIAKEQEAARAAAEAEKEAEVTNPQPPVPPASGKEMYVEATAYSVEGSPTHERITKYGYDIGTNPDMKMIAIDPTVIPPHSRVWVEGYGEAIAGDTGSAIIGHKIDVLMPSNAAAIQWGRKRVKLIILD